MYGLGMRLLVGTLNAVHGAKEPAAFDGAVALTGSDREEERDWGSGRENWEPEVRLEGKVPWVPTYIGRYRCRPVMYSHVPRADR